MGYANHIKPFFENIKLERSAGYFQRDPDMFSRNFAIAADHYRMTYAFIEAIRHLAMSNTDYDIVLRPHPTESIEAWKVFLEGIPNSSCDQRKFQLRHGSIVPLP